MLDAAEAVLDAAEAVLDAAEALPVVWSAAVAAPEGSGGPAYDVDRGGEVLGQRVTVLVPDVYEDIITRMMTPIELGIWQSMFDAVDVTTLERPTQGAGYHFAESIVDSKVIVPTHVTVVLTSRLGVPPVPELMMICELVALKALVTVALAPVERRHRTASRVNAFIGDSPSSFRVRGLPLPPGLR